MSRSSPSIQRTGLGDTTAEAQAVLDDVFRRMPVERKWKLLRQEQRRLRMFAAAGKQLREGERVFMNHAGEDIDVLRSVVGALDQVGIAYALGGSMASSIYGVMRSTLVADLTVEPFAGREQALANCFDLAYLNRWAAELAVDDLLQEALAAAGMA